MDQGKTVSAAMNWTNSVPQTVAKTFALSSIIPSFFYDTNILFPPPSPSFHHHHPTLCSIHISKSWHNCASACINCSYYTINRFCIRAYSVKDFKLFMLYTSSALHCLGSFKSSTPIWIRFTHWLDSQKLMTFTSTFQLNLSDYSF